MFARPLSKVCVFPCPLLIDGHAFLIGRSVFTQKQVFGPRTAKSQPIWLQFCTHLIVVMYGIRLWADLDRVNGVERRFRKKTVLQIYAQKTQKFGHYRAITHFLPVFPWVLMNKDLQETFKIQVDVYDIPGGFLLLDSFSSAVNAELRKVGNWSRNSFEGHWRSQIWCRSMDKIKYTQLLRRDAMRKRGLCCRPMSVRLSVRLVGGLHSDGWRYRQTSFLAR